MKLGSKKIFFAVSIIFSTFYFIFSVLPVRAADLYFSPASGTYKVGNSVISDFFVSSNDQAMNAVSAEISFSPETLEVTSLSKEGSIIDFWLHQPTFSNQTGKINFEGVIFNPGFKGTGAKVLSIKFRIKAAGTARLSLSYAYVLANDGKGTNILKNLGEARYVFSNNQLAPESSTPSNIQDAPLAPQIFSSTHPDPNKWYAYRDAKFTWAVPAGITGLRLAYDKNATSNLDKTTVYNRTFSIQEYKGVTDGVWYFHLQFSNKYGWGSVANFRFNIDSNPPAPFDIEWVDSDENQCPSYPKPLFKFKTTDSLSGVEYYEYKIDDADPQIITSEEMTANNDILTLEAQKPGDHLLSIRAVDRAGNYSFASKHFCIKALPAPIFTDYPTTVNLGQAVIIRGNSIGNAMVRIFYQREDDPVVEEVIRSNNDGNFSFLSGKNMTGGLYTFWAEAIDMNGALSDSSEKINFIAEEPWLLKLGKGIINYLSVIIVIISLLLVVFILIFHFVSRVKNVKMKIKMDVDEAAESSQKVFGYLRDEVENQVSKLDGQPGLSEREAEINESLKKAVTISEEMLKKDIKNIEKEIK